MAGVSEDYHLREEFQKFAVPDFLSRSHEERSSYIRKLSLATLEDLHAADGPESFGWAAGTGCEKSKPTSRDVIGCHTEMLSRDVEGFDCLYEDPRLETILSASREAMVKKARLLLDTNGVWRGPPTSDGKVTFSVSSISPERPKYVVIDKNTGSVECECTNCKSQSVFTRFNSCRTRRHFPRVFRFLCQAADVQKEEPDKSEQHPRERWPTGKKRKMRT